MHVNSFLIFVLLVVFVCSISPTCKNRQPSPTCLYTSDLPENEKYCSDQRCMPAVGNGYIGTFIMSDELHVAGVYNGKSNVRPENKIRNRKHNEEAISHHTHRARIPSTAAINFTLIIPGERSFALDVQHGAFYQWFNSQNIQIEQRTYAHRVLKNIIVSEISILANEAFDLTLLNNRGNESVDINFHYQNNGEDLPYKVMLGTVNEMEHPGMTKTAVALVWSKIPNIIHISKSNQIQTFRFISTIVTSLEYDDPVSVATDMWLNASITKNLFDLHQKEWSSLWKQANITIDGNLKLSQVVYSSLYNIISSIRNDWLFGLSPGSLAGGGEYLGHVFWDQDIWMYPTILMLYPELAKSLLQYRFTRLQSAQAISKKYGYQGAMYPWESALSGFEVCPEEVYGRNEIHITGDIAFAINQYYLATGDLKWIAEYGIHIVFQAAKFWTSRVFYNKSKNAYVINDVMPPDEYQYPVNNSFYTNVIAKMNLESAIMFGKLLNIPTPKEWELVAQNIYLPFDSKLDYHPEFEGFDISKKETVVKQADVILTNFPLMFSMKNTTIKNDLEYYDKVTDPNGPAMTHSMFTVGWLQIGNLTRAEKSFEKNFENINGPFRVWSEVRYGRGARNFITAAGGFLQSLVFGYGGLRLKPNGLHFNLRKPANTNQAELNGISYKGNRIRFVSVDNWCIVELLKYDEYVRPLYVIYTSGKIKRLYLNKPLYVCSGILAMLY